MSVDMLVFLAINGFARVTPWLHTLMLVFTTYGVVLFAALLVGGWWLARQQVNPRVMAAAVWAPIGVLLALGVNQPISAAVGETRPCRALSHIVVIAPQCGGDPSFPSDHGVMAGAAAGGLLLVGRRVLVWLTVLAALLIAFSRVYVAAHYPQDVVAGLLLGAVVSVAGYLLVRGGLTRLIIALQATVLRPVLTSAPAAADREAVTESVPDDRMSVGAHAARISRIVGESSPSSDVAAGVVARTRCRCPGRRLRPSDDHLTTTGGPSSGGVGVNW